MKYDVRGVHVYAFWSRVVHVQEIFAPETPKRTAQWQHSSHLLGSIEMPDQAGLC